METQQGSCQVTIEDELLILSSSTTEIKQLNGQLVSDTTNFRIKLDANSAVLLQARISEFLERNNHAQ